MTHQKGERDGARLLIIGGGAVLLLLLALLEIGFVEEIRRRWFCV